MADSNTRQISYTNDLTDPAGSVHVEVVGAMKERLSVDPTPRAFHKRHERPRPYSRATVTSCSAGTPACSRAASSSMSNGAPIGFWANAADRIQACCSS